MKKANKHVDKIDEIILRKINKIDMQQDFWDDLPSHVKDDVDEALQQSEKGEGKPHEKVMKKYAYYR